MCGIEAARWVPRAERVFLGSVAGILVITGLLKLVSAVGMRGSVAVADPLFYFLNQTDMLVGVGVVELGVATFLVMSGNALWRLGAVLWLASLFLLYRLGLVFIGFQGNCLCLGKPRAWMLGPEGRRMDGVMAGMLAYMLVLSLMFLWWRRHGVVTSASAEASGGGEGGGGATGGPAKGVDGYGI